MDKSSSMIELGAGMGGATREIAASTGAYVTAFEFDPELAEEGPVQADVVGLEKKASVLVLDPQNHEFKQNFYGGAFIHEALFRLEDKEAMLKSVIDSIKVDAQIVIWDLFFGEPEPVGPLQEWLTGENGEAFPWSDESAREILADNLIDVRVATDDTDRYCAMAIDAWSEFVKQITADPVGEDMVIPIIREVELWSRRIAAMQAGELKIYRFTGIKRKPVE
jgi:SAM-dependent methyltransferase